MVLPLAASRLAHERGAGSVFNLNPSRLGRRKVKFAAQPIDFLGNIQACQAAAQQVTVRWGGFRGKFRETAHRTTPSREYRGEKIGGVRHYVRDVGVARSNPVTPTTHFRSLYFLRQSSRARRRTSSKSGTGDSCLRNSCHAALPARRSSSRSIFCAGTGLRAVNESRPSACVVNLRTGSGGGGYRPILEFQ